MQLATPASEVYGRIQAVFRTLAYAPERLWMLGLYRRVPGAEFVGEAPYRVVARHRGFFSWLTRIGRGRDAEPPSYILSRSIFLRLLGLVYVIAFVSLWGQLAGLVGAHGILPAGNFRRVRSALMAQTPSIFSRRLPGSTRAMLGSSSCAAPEHCLGCW